MKLPNARHAYVERRKVANYLLSTTHPKGRNKANFFLRFGFSSYRWEELAEALKLLVVSHEVTDIVETEFGICYQVDGVIETPDGRNPQIITIWQIDWGSTDPKACNRIPT